MTKDDLLAELAARAPNYVPEWRYNPSSPDAGAALTEIWAELFSGTLERFEHLPDNCRRALLDVIGSHPKLALPSRGVLTFQSEGTVYVPAGTGIACRENPEVVLDTDRALITSPAHIDAIYYASPSRDAVRLYPGRENITLFNAEPSAPHIWTLLHPYAFQVSPQASLRLRVELQNMDTAALCEQDVIWEYGDGERWEPLTARPDGDAILFPGERELECRALRFALRGGIVSDATLRAVTALPSGNTLFPDAVYAGDIHQSGDQVYPFDRRFLPGLCFYVASEDALSKPGALIEVSFYLSFEDFPIEGYPETQIRLKKLMKASELEPPKEYVIDIAEVIWEYYNGTGWAVLRAGEPDMFSDGSSRWCKLRFVCPDDISAAVWGAHELPFIRARVLTVNNLFRMHGHYRTPVISGLRIRYAGGFPVLNVEVFEHMDTRIITHGNPVSLRGALEAEAVYLAFDNPFSQGNILFDLEPGNSLKLRWEYAVAENWKPLDIHDGTDGLSKTGILTYQSSEPCSKIRLYGREAYWMRISLMETDSFMRPRLIGLYENAVTASARIPGTEANLPPGAFHTLLTPVAGISTVFNPLFCAGGVAEEDEESVIQRLTSGLFHNDRAVSPTDCEALALEASPLVLRVRFYSRTDENGANDPDCDCLALFAEERSNFETLKREVLTYVETRRPLGAGRLCVVPARLIGVCATVYATIAAPEDALNAKSRIMESLARYLDTIESHWHIGSLPTPEEISVSLHSFSPLSVLTVYTVNGAPADYKRAARVPFTLPTNGKHEIFFRVAS